jgi:acyl-CoA thioesterase-1
MYIVVFFGDSITFGQYVDPKYTWTTIITNNLKKEKELITFRHAVSGETSRQLLLRYSRDVQEMSPDILTIQCGLNDCNYWQTDKGLPRVSKESYKANLNEMIDRAKAFDIKKIIFIGSHPVTKNIGGSITLEESRREYNQIFKKVAEKRDITYIDIESQFDNIDKYLLEDGLHLSDKGHIKYAEIIEPFIIKYLHLDKGISA